MKRLILVLSLIAVFAASYGQREVFEKGQTPEEFREAGNTAFNDHTDSLKLLFNTSGYINAENYGLTGDGSTVNNSAFIVACDSAMSSGKALYIPEGTYLFSGQTNITLDGDLRIIGSEKAILKGDAYIQFKSSFSSTDAMDQDCNKMADFIVDNTLSAEVGEVIQITSTEWWGNQASFYKGELVRVRKVSGDTLFLEKELFDSYSSATSSYVKCNAYAVEIDGLHFDGIGLDIQYAQDVIVSNNTLINLETPVGINIVRTYRSMVFNNVVTRQEYTGHKYGIDINSSCFATVIYNYTSTHDQAIISGGTYPCRHVKFNHNYIANGTGSGQIDFHPNLEYGEIIGNYVIGKYQGIYAKGLNVRINENEIVLLEDGQIGITKAEESIADTANANFHKCDYIEIKDNKVYDGVDTLLNTIGIRISWETWYDTIDFVDISGNFCRTSGPGFTHTESQAPYKNHIKRFHVSDNYFQATGPTGVGMHESTSEAWTCEEMSIVGNHIIGPYIGFYVKMSTDSGVYEIDRLLLKDNSISTEGNYAVLVQGVRTFVSENNIYEGGYVFNQNVNWSIMRNDIHYNNPSSTKVNLNTYVNNSLIDHNLYIGGASENNIIKSNTLEIDYSF